MGSWILLMALGFEPAASTLPPRSLGLDRPVWEGALVRKDADGRYWVSTGIEGTPTLEGWRVVPDASCVALQPASAAELARAPAVPGKDSALPALCAQLFEGTCTSHDGRVRISTSFKGKTKTRRVRSGFYGGEGWMNDEFRTGERSLVVEEVASGRRAVFVERLRNESGYTAGLAMTAYLPEAGAVLLFGIGEQRKPVRSYCVPIAKK
jgi:hypothetical protein